MATISAGEPSLSRSVTATSSVGAEEGINEQAAILPRGHNLSLSEIDYLGLSISVYVGGYWLYCTAPELKSAGTFKAIVPSASSNPVRPRKLRVAPKPGPILPPSPL
jgi:hypothetical protein